MSVRDRLSQQERTDAQADTSAGPQDWKAGTVAMAQARATQSANRGMMRDAQEEKAQLAKELAGVNEFLKGHPRCDIRGQHHLSIEAWMDMPVVTREAVLQDIANLRTWYEQNQNQVRFTRL